jgi:carboxypeptidase family protein
MNKRMLIYSAAAVLLAFLALSLPGAQVSTAKSTIHGIVTDPSGAAIPGASVLVSGPYTSQAITTGENGEYAVRGLAPGHYRVQVHSPGFSSSERAGLVLSAGYETEADVQLSVSALKQEITVTSRAD